MVSLSSNLTRTCMVVLFTAQQQPAQSYYGMPRLYPPLGAPPPGLPPNYMPSTPAQGSTMQSFQRPPPQPPSGMPPPMMNANFAQPPPSVGSIQHVATTQAFTNNTNTSNAGAPSLPPPPLGAANMPPPSTPQTITPAIPQNAVPPPNTNFAPPPLPAIEALGLPKKLKNKTIQMGVQCPQIKNLSSDSGYNYHKACI